LVFGYKFHTISMDFIDGFWFIQCFKTEIPKLQHTEILTSKCLHKIDISNLLLYFNSTAFTIYCYIPNSHIQSLLNISFDRSFVVLNCSLLISFFFCVNFVLNTHKAITAVQRKIFYSLFAVNQVVFYHSEAAHENAQRHWQLITVGEGPG
jgi:hypothetical protein